MPVDTLLPLRPGLSAHASGALWLPETRTAVVADLHLGYSWAQRRRGELGPLADERTREKLLALRNELNPEQFVFLGDIVHAPRSCTPEREWIEETLADVAAHARLIAVRGNHDRRFASEFGHLNVQAVDAWSATTSAGDLTMAHGDRWTFAWPEHHMLVLGHLHPSLSVRDASGAAHKLPVFLFGPTCLVLPAFSPFARGYNIACGLPEEMRKCFGASGQAVFAATGKRVVQLGPLAAALQKMADDDTSSAAHFRRHRRRA